MSPVSKPVLMIHEFCEDMLELPLEKYILTFDDGLFTQFKHLEKIKAIDTEKIFFISTNIVAGDNVAQTSEFISCSAAHDRFNVYNDCSYYMNWEQVHEINNTPGCTIGGHSHDHIHKPNLKQIIQDTNKMMSTFNQHNINITSFCFPYNDELPMYRSILKSKGVVEFYGKERVDIYELSNR